MTSRISLLIGNHKDTIGGLITDGFFSIKISPADTSQGLFAGGFQILGCYGEDDLSPISKGMARTLECDSINNFFRHPARFHCELRMQHPFNHFNGVFVRTCFVINAMNDYDSSGRFKSFHFRKMIRMSDESFFLRIDGQVVAAVLVT